MLGFFVKGLSPSDIKLSIIGEDDVIGKEKPHASQEKSKADELLIKYTPHLFTLIGAIMIMLFAGPFYTSRIEMIHYYNQMDAAETYMETNRFDLALKEYERIAWWIKFKAPTRFCYKIAISYVKNGDYKNSIIYLKKLKKNNKNLFDIVIMEDVFDSLRTSADFIELISEESKKSKK